MKTIGIIGGTSCHSTRHYYRIINQYVNDQLGGQNAARIIMTSINFQDIFKPPVWDELEEIFTGEAKRLETAGADFFIMCSNGLHPLTEVLRKAVAIPFLSIIDCVADEIKKKGFKKVGLIGTVGTMTDGYYIKSLAAHEIETIVPDEDGVREINRIIFEELTLGKFTNESRKTYANIIEKLAAEGAQGVILGCTEIPLLMLPEKHGGQKSRISVPISMLDTLTIHAEAAARFSLS